MSHRGGRTAPSRVRYDLAISRHRRHNFESTAVCFETVLGPRSADGVCPRVLPKNRTVRALEAARRVAETVIYNLWRQVAAQSALRSIQADARIGHVIDFVIRLRYVDFLDRILC